MLSWRGPQAKGRTRAGGQRSSSSSSVECKSRLRLCCVFLTHAVTTHLHSYIEVSAVCVWLATAKSWLGNRAPLCACAASGARNTP